MVLALTSAILVTSAVMVVCLLARRRAAFPSPKRAATASKVDNIPGILRGVGGAWAAWVGGAVVWVVEWDDTRGLLQRWKKGGGGLSMCRENDNY